MTKRGESQEHRGPPAQVWLCEMLRVLIPVLDHSASPLSNCQPMGVTHLGWDKAWYIVPGVAWVCLGLCVALVVGGC